MVASWSAGADTDQKLLGDVSDGSRAASIHLIPLFPENEKGEKGQKITPDDEPLLPFSTRWTCGSCHNYQLISKGWHYNAIDPNVPAGRPGQPWIFFDAATGMQIPLSYRCWPGTFRPEQLGLTPREFTKLFGRHTPGGGSGELESGDIEESVRQYISGKLEINCLSCHNAHPGQNQGGIDGYAVQISRENFRWAAAASCEFATVRGSAEAMTDTYDPFMPDLPASRRRIAPRITYQRNAFDDKNQVFFNIVREVPNHRCYFCHSNLDIDENRLERWAADEDVHLMAGLSCVDCHREGIEHNTIRGYEGEDVVSKNPISATSTCVGCHTEGRLGAPVPDHPGIPTVHFDKLSCTACHSGPWPSQKTILTKTSRAHRLGTFGSNKSPQALPHIIYPVFARQSGISFGYASALITSASDGKIAPHKLIWPAYWGTLKDEKVSPIALETVNQIVGKILAKQRPPHPGVWPAFKPEHITDSLKELKKSVEGAPVYIAGGTLYYLDDAEELHEHRDHPATQPYLWPIAHNVRPAAQSLGIHSCGDCHSTDAAFFFGEVAVDSPVGAQEQSAKKMVEFQDIDAFYARAFAFTFVFRPWLKVVALASCAVLGAVLLLYALKALACIIKTLAGEV